MNTNTIDPVDDTAQACRLARLEGIRIGARAAEDHLYVFWPPSVPHRFPWEGADTPEAKIETAKIEGVREGIERILVFAEMLGNKSDLRTMGIDPDNARDASGKLVSTNNFGLDERS